jgi:undecaprenyl-diphosphatase
MTYFQIIVAAVFQGITELFPVSSLGHAVILPAVLGWNIDQQSPEFLPFLVVLHVGTAAALLIYFWREWLGLFMAVLGRSSTTVEVRKERHVFALLVLGTLPAVVLGFAFEKWLRHLFGSPVAAAVFLIVNGAVLFAGEHCGGALVHRATGEGLYKPGGAMPCSLGCFRRPHRFRAFLAPAPQ